MKRLGIGLLSLALLAGSFWIGVGVQYHHDQRHLAQLQADNRRLISERDTAQQARDTAQQEAQDSAAQATEARAQAEQVKAASDSQVADAKMADRVGFIRGFCTAAFALGTPKATLGQVVYSIDDSLWSACDDGIGIALKVQSGQSASVEAPPPALTPPPAPAVPNYVYGGILCSDGSISHAAHRQGACSWHGGIAP